MTWRAMAVWAAGTTLVTLGFGTGQALVVAAWWAVMAAGRLWLERSR